MSANNAEPTGEVKDNPDEPISDQNGVDYDSYASGGDTAKSNGEGINFDSQDLKKRQKTEYFVNIEGAEKIKREEERRQAEEEKRRFAELNRMDAEMRNNSIQPQQHTGHSEEVELRKITKQQKKREKNAARRTRNARISANLKAAASTACKKLFGGKKKFIWLGAVLAAAIIVGGIVINNNVVQPAVEKHADEDFEKYKENSRKTISEIESTVGEMILSNESDDNILSYIKGELDKYSSNDDQYAMVAIYYGDMLGRRKNLQEGISFLKSIENSAKRDYEKERLYYAYYVLYSMSQDFTNGDKYANMINSMKRRVVVDDVVSSREYYEANKK